MRNVSSERCCFLLITRFVSCCIGRLAMEDLAGVDSLSTRRRLVRCASVLKIHTAMMDLVVRCEMESSVSMLSAEYQQEGDESGKSRLSDREVGPLLPRKLHISDRGAGVLGSEHQPSISYPTVSSRYQWMRYPSDWSVHFDQTDR